MSQSIAKREEPSALSVTSPEDIMSAPEESHSEELEEDSVPAVEEPSVDEPSELWEDSWLEFCSALWAVAAGTVAVDTSVAAIAATRIR